MIASSSKQFTFRHSARIRYNSPMRKPKEPDILDELDRWLAAVQQAEERICRALAGGGEATFRLIVKVDKGKIVSRRIESNEEA